MNDINDCFHQTVLRECFFFFVFVSFFFLFSSSKTNVQLLLVLVSFAIRPTSIKMHISLTSATQRSVCLSNYLHGQTGYSRVTLLLHFFICFRNSCSAVPMGPNKMVINGFHRSYIALRPHLNTQATPLCTICHS